MTAPEQPVTWNEDNGDEPTNRPPSGRPCRLRDTPIDLDALADGRCKASSWRVKRPAKATYENHFGPGGFNRCIGSEGHANPTHKDEWGYVFVADDGSVRILRLEERAS